MYPRLSDLFRDFLGIELPFPIYSFGAMVAVGILSAAWLLGRELDRLYAEKLLPGVRVSGKGGKKKGSEISSPSVLVGTFVLVAFVGGFAGARVFHILENLGAFVADPAGMIFTRGGFTFYGGLIVAGVSIAWIVHRKGLHVPTASDAFAPGLMLAYGIGRLGCHLAGDGDWGINADLAARPGWLPEWLWAETYPNNVLGVDLSAHPVYPTPIYEFVGCVLLFAILWKLRKHPFAGGWLFSVYFLLTGLERFLIEQIRVNNTFMVFGLELTQAEVISVLIMALGALGMVLTRKRRATLGAGPPASKSSSHQPSVRK
jgi:phosphatidylglycerol:prolipoprotein diacylglycerol transferase